MHPVPRSAGLLHPLLAPRYEAAIGSAGRQRSAPYGARTARSRLLSCPACLQATRSACAIQAPLPLLRPSVPD
eukprot:6772763-Lingulodinium_polyedra.AAC.1